MLTFSPQVKRWIAYLRKIFLDNEGGFRPWTVPVVLFGTAVLAYGLYAPQLGFYWDDWTFAWARNFRGLAGLQETFFTRPLRGYVEYLLGLLLGVKPLSWQLFALLMRWAASVSLWWCLYQLWPRYWRLHFVTAVFALLYPGFSQQSLAMTYGYFWIFQAVFFLSFGLMVWGIRVPHRVLPAMTGALLLSTVQLFSSEYLVGLELLRPVFVWLALGQLQLPHARRLLRTVVYSLPFLAVLGIYFYWRAFVFESSLYQPVLLDIFRASPLEGIKTLITQALTSFATVTIDAWVRIIQIPLAEWRTVRFFMLYLIVVLVSLAVLLFYQNRLPLRDEVDKSSPGWKQPQLRQMLIIALLAILVAGFPVYVTTMPITVTFENDRLTMPFFFGVSLLLSVLAEMSLNHWQRNMFVSILVALAIGLQLYNACLYRNETNLQQNFTWQLLWRVPNLEPGTLILSDDSAFPYTDDEGISFMLNWIYAPDNDSGQFEYAFNTLSNRLGNGIPSLNPHVAVYEDYYSSASFAGSTDNAIVLYFSPPSCLRILNPDYDRDLIFQSVVWREGESQPSLQEMNSLPPLTWAALPLSNLAQITPVSEINTTLPTFVLSPEPRHIWCYYFEKADLARQGGDWSTVAELGDEAMTERSLHPADLSEYLIFIEADLYLGRLQEAQLLSQNIIDWAPVMNPSVCAVWQRVQELQDRTDGESMNAIMQQSLGCFP